jgi:hypothetical protein
MKKTDSGKAKGCNKKAEIASWYSQDLTKAGNCIGEAAVFAALNAAAETVCCDTLKCPEKCRCHFIPRKKLASYKCTPGKLEEGFLLQGEEVWNCQCGEVG